MNFISSIMPRKFGHCIRCIVLICAIYGSILRNNLLYERESGGRTLVTGFSCISELLYNNHAELRNGSAPHRQVVASLLPILRILKAW